MKIVTFEDDGGAYNQADAGGFIKLNALRMRIAAKLEKTAATAPRKATRAAGTGKSSRKTGARSR